MLTTEAQPPQQLTTDAGICVKVVHQTDGHKWLGCMMSVGGSKSHLIDVNYHLQNASKAFYANRWLLCDRSVGLAQRLRFFNHVITPVACFGSGVWRPYRDSLRKLDVEFRRFLRQLVGPPADTDWSQQWHVVLHSWHANVQHEVDKHDIPTWSTEYLKRHWGLAGYLVSLPKERWVLRVLEWTPNVSNSVGRPDMT